MQFYAAAKLSKTRVQQDNSFTDKDLSILSTQSVNQLGQTSGQPLAFFAIVNWRTAKTVT
jgi:hypothetical protein